MRYALILSYKGTAYHGWQRQNNAITVQQLLEEKLAILSRESAEITGCGRTDTGVHASYYVAHVDLNNPLVSDAEYRLNGMLPADIAVHKIAAVSDDFHARFDATAREYAYHIHFAKNPFKIDNSWQRPKQYNFEAMNRAAQALLGVHSFECFCKGPAPTDNFNCKIYKAEWQVHEDHAVFVIRANRFLRNMVRAIVGTLMEIGTDKMSLDEFCQLIEMGTRKEAGNSVPAHGLFLTDVSYPILF